MRTHNAKDVVYYNSHIIDLRNFEDDKNARVPDKYLHAQFNGYIVCSSI